MATTVWNGTTTNWSTSGNWTNGVPATGDHVYFENNSQSVTSGFPGTVQLGSLNIDQSYTGSLATAASGNLSIGVDVLNIGYHNGPGSPTGSPSIFLDLGPNVSVITVYNTGTSADTSMAPVRLKGAHTDNTLVVYKGNVEFGTATTDTTSQLDHLTVSYDTKVATDSDVFIGDLAAVIDTVTILGGDVFLEEGVTTVTIKDGTLKTSGSGAIGTLNVNGGTVTSNSTGTITALNVFGGTGTVDFTKNNASREVTATKLDPGGIIKVNSTDVTSLDIVPYTATRNITFTAS